MPNVSLVGLALQVHTGYHDSLAAGASISEHVCKRALSDGKLGATDSIAFPRDIDSLGPKVFGGTRGS
jgi:hypothetical protein